jgi:short-subunit dehydrogenase
MYHNAYSQLITYHAVGLSICRAFAEAGVSKLIISARRAKPLQEAKAQLSKSYPSVNIETIELDVGQFDEVTKALEAAGPIDVLVFNAFYSHQHFVPSVTIPASEIAKTFNINVAACYHMLSTYIASCPKPSSGEKAFINVSSAGSHLYIPQQAGYGASKAAMTKILSAMADEHAPQIDGARLMNYHPGIIFSDAARENSYTDDSFEWEDVNLPGDFAVWLAGKESTFLHGRFVWAQWDVDELITAKERMEKDKMFLKMGLFQ